MNKNLRKGINTRSRLTKRTNKTDYKEDLRKYKMQRYPVAKLNRASKWDLFKRLETRDVDNYKKFWKAVKPLLSNTNPMGGKIFVVEKGKIFKKESWVEECLNSYFVKVTDRLGLEPLFVDMDQNGKMDQKVNGAIEKCKHHDSTLLIKERPKNVLSFRFSHFSQ